MSDKDRDGQKLQPGDRVEYEPGVGGKKRVGTVRFTGLYGVDVQQEGTKGIFGQRRALNRTVRKLP